MYNISYPLIIKQMGKFIVRVLFHFYNNRMIYESLLWINTPIWLGVVVHKIILILINNSLHNGADTISTRKYYVVKAGTVVQIVLPNHKFIHGNYFQFRVDFQDFWARKICIAHSFCFEMSFLMNVTALSKMWNYIRSCLFSGVSGLARKTTVLI